MKENSGDVEIEASITNANKNFSIEVNEVSGEEFKSFSGVESIDKEYEVDFNIPGSPFQVLDSSSGSKTEAGVRAYLRITYTRNARGDINISNVSGGWSPTSSIYVVSSRQVVVRVGNFAGAVRSLSFNPASNSFNRSITWGFVPYYPNTAFSMTGANTFANIRVTGMGGSHEIALTVTI